MATAAADKALANSGLTAADIDLVVVATCTSVDRSPNVACRVAAKLGINAPGAYDLNTACSGFSYALGTADHAIRAGAARNALVIGAEKLSDFTDWTDRSTCIIFGDGAGAAVVTATADGEAPGVGPVVWGSAPEKSDAVRIEGWRAVHPAGGPVGVPLGHHRARPAGAAGLRAGRRRARGHRGVRAAPGQRPHHRRASPSGSSCPTP